MCVCACGWGVVNSSSPLFFFCPRIPHWRRAEQEAQRRSPRGSEESAAFFVAFFSFFFLKGSLEAIRQGERSVRAIVEVAADAHCPLPSLYMSLPFQTPGSSQFYLTVFHFSLAVTACLHSCPAQDRFNLTFYTCQIPLKPLN